MLWDLAFYSYAIFFLLKRKLLSKIVHKILKEEKVGSTIPTIFQLIIDEVAMLLKNVLADKEKALKTALVFYHFHFLYSLEGGAGGSFDWVRLVYYWQPPLLPPNLCCGWLVSCVQLCFGHGFLPFYCVSIWFSLILIWVCVPIFSCEVDSFRETIWWFFSFYFFSLFFFYS